MKIFPDAAEIDEIRTAARWGALDGVTTNPTVFAKVGGSHDDVLQICQITPTPPRFLGASPLAPTRLQLVPIGVAESSPRQRVSGRRTPTTDQTLGHEETLGRLDAERGG